MTVAQFLDKVNYALRGIDDDAPAFGTDEANYWLSILNDKKDELYEDVTKNWSNVWSVASLGTVAASATPSYNLSATFLGSSDKAYIVKTDGTRTNYTIVKPNEQSTALREVYVAGDNPQKLYFTNEIEATEDIIGGTLYLPGYFLPTDLDAEDDVLPFPNPKWAVAAVAAEVAFGDITYEDKAETLNNKANFLYGLMVKKNRRGTHQNGRSTPYNVKRIRDTRVN